MIHVSPPCASIEAVQGIQEMVGAPMNAPGRVLAVLAEFYQPFDCGLVPQARLYFDHLAPRQRT